MKEGRAEKSGLFLSCNDFGAEMTGEVCFACDDSAAVATKNQKK